MKLIEQIEKKYGFQLPKMYRQLAESGRLDSCLHLPDGRIEELQEVADHEWEDYLNPIDGLVPFAANGAGEPYCWLLSTPTNDGEFAVIEAQQGEGIVFAPSVAGTIFRATFHFYASEAQEEIDEDFDEVLALLQGNAPQAWCDTLSGLKELPSQENKFGCHLLTDEEQTAVIQKLFGDEYIEQEIEWELDEDDD